MKISVNVKKIVNKLNQVADDLAKDSVNKVVDYASKQAQNGFDRFMLEVPADDPVVDVFTTAITKLGNTYSRTIECRGNQVLFIEFGAGRYFYTGDTEARLYQSVMPKVKLRPKGILDIGEYGSGRGNDDLWFYKSHTGRESENAHLIKYNRSGDPIMITHGNRPARALYRAVGMAMRRLYGGKLK